VADSVEIVRGLAPDAKAAGLPLSVTIAASFGCPFEGEVPEANVIELARQVADLGVDEIALADTIGVGVPAQVRRLLAGVAEVAPGVRTRCHFHNTRNTGYANAIAALESGVSALDSSTGGIGGCPFAPAATGNIATEDLVYLLDRSGVATGVDLGQVIATADWLSGVLGERVPALLGRAGTFPG
jgi:hydroxymethylglutaryl-CoA lyase